MVNINLIIEFRSCIMWENITLCIRTIEDVFHFDAIADMRDRFYDWFEDKQ